MNKKVWVVMDGEYQQTVYGVYSSYERARLISKALHCGIVIDFVVDDGFFDIAPMLRDGKRMFFVSHYPQSDDPYYSVRQVNPGPEGRKLETVGPGVNYNAFVWAADEEDAVDQYKRIREWDESIQRK